MGYFGFAARLYFGHDTRGMVGQGIADITVLTINRQTGHAPDEQGGRCLLLDVRSMRFGCAILAGGSPGVIGGFGKERLRPTVSPLGDMVRQTGCDDTCHAGHGRRLSGEALSLFEVLRNRQPSADPGKCWDELEIRLLSSEADAMILYDPVFPADPFAH